MKKIRKSRLIVINNNKVLVLKRVMPDKVEYSIPGGFIKQHETPKEGLLREVEEEINAKIDKQDIQLLFSFTFRKKNHWIKKNYYLLKKSHKYTFILKEKKRFDEIVWINSIELLKHMEAKEKLIIEAFILNQSLFYGN